MRSLPDLDRLRVAEKDDLIRSLFGRVQELTVKVAELEGRLAQNSRNSSKPPSADGYGKPKPKPLPILLQALQRRQREAPYVPYKGNFQHRFISYEISLLNCAV
jgi:hypothetical protein